MHAVEHPAELDLPTAVEINLTFDGEDSIMLAFADTWAAARQEAAKRLCGVLDGLNLSPVPFQDCQKANSARRAELENLPQKVNSDSENPLLKWATEACETERAKCGDVDEDYIPSWLPELEAAVKETTSNREN